MADARGPIVSSVAAMGSLVAAVSCCLPAGTFLAAAGAAGAARILTPLRPWLIGLSVLSLVVGFVQTYVRSQCTLRRNPVSVALLWIAAAMVVIMLLFPQVIAGLLADWLPAE